MEYTQEDYWTLLLIYAAHADLEVRSTEVEYIVKRFGNERFKKMNNFFKQHSDYEVIQWLKSHKDRFMSSDEDRNQMLQSVKAVFESDEEVDLLERNFLWMLRHVIEV